MKRVLDDKKGASIWISAAIYFGLGMVVLSIILAAGMPVMNKLRDKNVIVQTKDVFFTLDNHVREVARGGPGTQRLLRVQMNRGSLLLDSANDDVIWSYTTNALLSEPGVTITEGSLQIMTMESAVQGDWETTLLLDYTDVIDVKYGDESVDASDVGSTYTFQGGTDLIIRNVGSSETYPDLIQVTINEVV